MSYSGNMNISGKRGMDREYEEMDINNSDVKTEREHLDTKRFRTPQNTVRIRNYRAAVVCLVLLCVLLLTAVIVLCVHIHTKNTNHTEDLAKQRVQLNQEKKELWDSIREMDGWIYYQSKFYFVSSEKKTWTDSERYCMEKGADLIIINKREEHDFVRKIFGQEKVWIGLTDSNVEGIWKWVDGSTLTSEFWASGEPNGHRKENCVMSYASGWADVLCNYEFRWICEKDILKFIT